MRLSVIILEYHSLNDVVTCVENIRKFDSECEIIVSSNSMYDEEGRKTAASFVPGVKWVFNEKNGGFSYGMNRGAKVAAGEYLMFLNSDVVLQESGKRLVDYLGAHPDVGIVAPRLTDANGVIQDSFRKFMNPLNFTLRQLRLLFHIRLDLRHYQPMTVDWVIGAFMVVRKSDFDMVGGFDESLYFMYVEDMDLCHEFKKHKLNTVYYPLVSAHFVGTKASRRFGKYFFIHLKSLLRYWRKVY